VTPFGWVRVAEVEEKKPLTSQRRKPQPRLKGGLLRCWACGEYKAPEEFHKDKAKKYGRSTECRAYKGSYDRDYQKLNYLKHRDRLLPAHQR